MWIKIGENKSQRAWSREEGKVACESEEKMSVFSVEAKINQ